MSDRTINPIDSMTGEKYSPTQVPATRAHIQELVKKAQLMLAKDHDLMAQAQAHWKSVSEAVYAKASATKPPMKVYEVHHLHETARLWFLADIAEGHTPEQAEANAKQSLETGFQ